jgi:threonine/homoserine/homoserine lactone efflux protein|tara:strand:- start:880 stop:1482 length:603 start_codon:yes stop_codon:yes gene_type:complete
MITIELTVALITFYFVMFVTPGPNNIMLTTSGIKYGFKKTIPHILGIPLGHFFQISLVSLGLGTLFQNYPLIQEILKVAGCLYLFFLAYKMFGSLSIKENKKETGRPLKFYEASLFQVLNPKAWVVAITAVSVFFPKDEHFITGIFYLAAIAPIICLPSISVWALFGSGIRAFVSNPKMKQIIEIVMAFLLIATGVMILI